MIDGKRLEAVFNSGHSQSPVQTRLRGIKKSAYKRFLTTMFITMVMDDR